MLYGYYEISVKICRGISSFYDSGRWVCWYNKRGTVSNFLSLTWWKSLGSQRLFKAPYIDWQKSRYNCESYSWYHAEDGFETENARRQCNDGALSMAGVKNDVAARINLMNEVALYNDHYGHALNLAVNDYIRNMKNLNDVWVNVLEYLRACNIFYLINGPRIMFGIFDLHMLKKGILSYQTT